MSANIPGSAFALYCSMNLTILLHDGNKASKYSYSSHSPARPSYVSRGSGGTNPPRSDLFYWLSEGASAIFGADDLTAESGSKMKTKNGGATHSATHTRFSQE